MPKRRKHTTDAHRYPPISDYALIGDCHSAALVSRTGSIDWCCMPRIDAGSSFARLLDWDRGGHWSIDAVGECRTNRSYVGNTMVLETHFTTTSGEARVVDCFTMHAGGATDPHRQLLRVVEGLRGTVAMRTELLIRFDYADIKPWLRFHQPGLWSATGGNDALVVNGDIELEIVDTHDFRGEWTVRAGDRVHLSVASYAPEAIDDALPNPLDADTLDERLGTTIEWWENWADQVTLDSPATPAVQRSALVLKALSNAPTGAIAAAPTTSLPEFLGGSRNWDYRYSWIRDSQFTVRALAEAGWHDEADGVRRFFERSTAGDAESLHIVYGLGGERRMPELELPLEGYRCSAPVRIGNAASKQVQLDVYGEILDLAWQWHERGRSPDDDYWRFLLTMVDKTASCWDEPDQGLWEMRGDPRHFVHSKVMCWVAMDRGIHLAEECLRQAPLDRWKKVRGQIRTSVEKHGIDPERDCFVQYYGSTDLDAALLLLPQVGFVAYDDPRMIATTEAIMEDLGEEGLLRRYRSEDGLEGDEGVFVACAFWLAETLAYQDRPVEAHAAYDRAVAAGNDVGLFAEEYDPSTQEALGNFPQALSHLAHISAAFALAGTADPEPRDASSSTP